MCLTDSSNKIKHRVAVVGGGVTGLAAAWHLHVNSPDVEVQLFEADSRLGGHAHTVSVPDAKKGDRDATVDVDVGFMIFNDSNYPNMTKWFETIGVEKEPTDMSLSVSLDDGKKVEWASHSLSGLLANKKQIIKPSFYNFISDMQRFNNEAIDLLSLHPDDPRRQVTLAQYLRNEGYSDAFASNYLLPMTAALWSASIEDVLNYPADQLVTFMCNHKMFSIFDRPTYSTVAGRSRIYTEKVSEILGKNAHVSCPIKSISKKTDGVESTTTWELFTKDSTSVGQFDDVIFACHTPTARSILKSEMGIDSDLLDHLNNIEYGENVVYLHSDPKLMPVRKAAWASWNCMGRSELLSTHVAKKTTSEAIEGGESGFGARFLDKETEEKVESNGDDSEEDLKKKLEGRNGRMKAVYVTYYLNRLQNLKCDKDVFVSLNPYSPPDPKLTYKRQIMSHPQFTHSSLQARDAIATEYQGKDGLWFCGAWTKYGFHEDGCRSGFKVATAISNSPLPWAEKSGELVLPTPDLTKNTRSRGLVKTLKHTLSYTLPVAICRRMVISFLRKAITRGSLQLLMNDGSIISFGDGNKVGNDAEPVTARVFDEWFFVKIATEFDLGLARAYMSGLFVVNNPAGESNEETNFVIGDPVGLTRLFLLFIHNRDDPTKTFLAKRSAKNHTYSNALVNASGLIAAKLGSLVNFLRFKLTMDNSERGGSLKNIHAHYDLSNDLFTSFLDKETYMYSSAIYDAVKAPRNQTGLVFRGTLEEAQWRKLDTLLARAQVQPGQKLLDIGFGWGGLSLHAAKKYGCQVTGITLSVEQKALAEERVKLAGLGNLITFEVVDYRVFARRKENQGRFDRVISCEMIEAVGHNHLGEFYWAVEQVLSDDGILVMEAITTPESRYETYIRSTDFINTIIFPGGCAPSLHALIDASYQWSTLTLEHIDNIGLHYAATLEEWRRRFNRNEKYVRKLGFDDVFMRVWNYYMTYCEAGFRSQTINCLILVFSRQGCNSLVPLCESRSVTQLSPMSEVEIENWIQDA